MMNWCILLGVLEVPMPLLNSGLQDMGSLNSNNQGNVSWEFNGITCTGMDAEQGRQVPVENGNNSTLVRYYT